MEYTKKLSSKYFKLWDELYGWKRFCFYAIHYTLVFIVLRAVIFSDFSEVGKTFQWKSDGTPIYFSNAVYFSKTIREGIQSLFSGGGWSIPLYDFQLGPGKLVPTEYSDLMIPLLSVFCPWDKVDVLFDILVIVRFYLAGLTFSAFGFYFKYNVIPVLTGAISYTFCGFMLYAGLRDNSCFFGAIILFPLFIIGIENVLRKKSPIPLLFLVFVAVSTELYFAYMLGIMLAFYTLARLFEIYRSIHFNKEFFSIVKQLFVCVGIGIALGGIFWIPTLINMLGTGRIGRNIADFTNLIHYSKEYYYQFFTKFLLLPDQFYSDTYLGFTILTLPAIFILFIQKNLSRNIFRFLFILTTLMMLTPSAAYTMSAFNAIKNRWGFMYAFVVCAILMHIIQKFDEIEKRSFIFAGLGMVLYFLISYFYIPRKYYNESTFVLLIASVLIILLLTKLPKWKVSIPMFCFAISCVSIVYSAYCLYDPTQRNFTAEFVDKGMPYGFLERSQYSSFSQSESGLSDQSFYRVAGDSMQDYELNASFYYGINGLTAYNSCIYSGYSDWVREMELARKVSSHRYFGLRSRSPLLTLAGVKYFVLRENGNSIEPYGFEEVSRVKNHDKTDVIFKNKYYLPLGYTFNTFLSEEQYKCFSALEKQLAQVQAIILKNPPKSSSIKPFEEEETAIRIPTEIKEMKNIVWEENQITVLEKGAEITLAFEGLPMTETYLRIVNLDLTNGDSASRWSVQVQTDSTKTDARFTPEGYIYDHGMKTQLLDLGFAEEGYTYCKIKFPQKGTFVLNDLEIWCQEMDTYQTAINFLREECLENIVMGWNGLEGDISVSNDKILCLSIPYDKGWTAYVDGEKADLLQGNTAFMAIEISKGEHRIELRYWPRGLTVGIVVSLLGILTVIGIWYTKYYVDCITRNDLH